MVLTQDLMNPADTTAIADSAILSSVEAYEAMLVQQKTALDSIEAQLARFETFEEEYTKGEMEAEVVTTEITKITEQQKAILAQQAQIKMELNKLNSELGKTKA